MARQTKVETRRPEAPDGRGSWAERAGALATRPWAILAAIAAIVLAVSWQFITDASRGVPAFDTAYYQWRVEYLLENSPGALIELRGAEGALAGGYRVAEPVLGALMRTVGGVAAAVPTIVLSILFRVLAAAGMAAFAWKHRRNWLVFYLSLLTIPALFFLQRFFGYMDNFMTAALLAGVLVLMDRMPESWGARIAVTAFLFLAGLSHPTTLAIFLAAMGAVAGYRLLRDRSLLAALRSEGLIVATGAVAVILTAAFWLGGLWGPTSSFSDAAVPPPETVDFFINRSVGVLQSLEPFFPLLILFPLMALAFVSLVVKVAREKEYFAEVTVAWTIPLLGMLGFLIGAAYPYFRFFNATLSPLLLAAVGLSLLILWALRIRSRPVRVPVAAVAIAFVTLILGVWWQRGLEAWNTGRTWLTPQIRGTMDAASAYLDAEPGGRQAVFVTDAQPGGIVPYGQYKEHANAINAGLDGNQIDDATLFFGRVEDLVAGTASTSSDPPYNRISADTAEDVLPLLREESGNVVVFMPKVFNQHSSNAGFLETCHPDDCLTLPDTGLTLLPEIGGTPASPASVAAAERAAAADRAFVADPPGPAANLGGTLLAALRLALLLLVPGWLFYRRFGRRSWPEGIALVPLFSIASVTTVGVFAMAVLRSPFTPAVGWASWAIAVALALFAGLPEGLRRRRDAIFAAPARLIDETSQLFRNRDFTFLMGAQWLAQAADGLVGVALAKLITFGGQAGLDVEAARSPRDALVIILLTFLPYTLFSPFLGVIIDRGNRRRLLIGANAIRFVVLSAIVVVGISVIGDAALYVSFLLILAGTRLLLAIKGAGLPAVLGEKDLMQGNSISQAGSAMFQLFGAGVALVASGFLGTRVILIGGILLYALATLAASGTGVLGYATRSTPLAEELRRLFRDMLEGFREVGRRAAAGLALLSFLTVRSMLTFTTLATVFLSRDLIAAKGTLSTAIPAAVGALGAGLGFVIAHVVRNRVRPARIVTGALMAGAAGMLAFGGIITLLGISLMAFSVGLGFFLGKVGVDTMMQQALSDQFRGRGFSLQDIAYNLSWVIPALVLFLLLTEDSARILLVAAGLVFLVIAVLIALAARRLPAPTAERAPGR
jgi:hypothetical protein